MSSRGNFVVAAACTRIACGRKAGLLGLQSKVDRSAAGIFERRPLRGMVNAKFEAGSNN
jgi:hypothetical protein